MENPLFLVRSSSNNLSSDKNEIKNELMDETISTINYSAEK